MDPLSIIGAAGGALDIISSAVTRVKAGTSVASLTDVAQVARV